MSPASLSSGGSALSAKEHVLPTRPFPALLPTIPLSPTLHTFPVAALSASENKED